MGKLQATLIKTSPGNGNTRSTYKVTSWGVCDRKAIQVVTTNFAYFAENGFFTTYCSDINASLLTVTLR